MRVSHVIPPADDNDTPRKNAVTRYFPECITFYLPDVCRKIGLFMVFLTVDMRTDSDANGMQL